MTSSVSWFLVTNYSSRSEACQNSTPFLMSGNKKNKKKVQLILVNLSAYLDLK